jgi:hypothetical protein
MRGLALALAVLLASACDSDGGSASPIGVPCSSDRECGELHCMGDNSAAPDDLDDEPLACGELTDAQAPGRACDDAEGCATRLCLLAGACAKPCEAARDCDASERCQDVFVRRGLDVLTRVAACVSAVDLPASASVERELREGALDTDEVDVPLPAVDPDETTLFVLEHESSPWPDTTFCRPPLCVVELRAGDQSLFRADACETGEASLVPVATGDHIDPVVIRVAGESAELGAEDGYVATLETEATGDLRLTRIASSARGQRLDLNLFYVGASRLEPEGDRGPALVAEALDVIDKIFAPADIFIGDVRQVYVGGELPERGLAFPNGDDSQGFTSLAVRFGVYAELPYLFQLSAGASNAAINIFFVGDIDPRAGSEPEAEAGGIPGPMGMHGTGGSGIVVAADMMGDPLQLGRTLAHELGHYLGLFHTSEANGCVRDVLPDTAACLPEDDVDDDGLDAIDCAAKGADNLMFFARTSGTVLTQQQLEVLRSAPILQ